MKNLLIKGLTEIFYENSKLSLRKINVNFLFYLPYDNFSVFLLYW